jgi:hypothetical protein
MAANRARRSPLPDGRQRLGARGRSASGCCFLDAELGANSKTCFSPCRYVQPQSFGSPEHRHLSAFALIVDPGAEHYAGRAIWRCRHAESGDLNAAPGTQRSRPKPASHGLRWPSAGRGHAHGKKSNQRALRRLRETLGFANAYEQGRVVTHCRRIENRLQNLRVENLDVDVSGSKPRRTGKSPGGKG